MKWSMTLITAVVLVFSLLPVAAQQPAHPPEPGKKPAASTEKDKDAAQQPAHPPVAETQPAVSNDKEKDKSEDKAENEAEKTAQTPPADHVKQPVISPPAIPGVQAAKLAGIPVEPDYVIGPQDVLEIYVWQEKDFSREVAVRPDGKISEPLLNDIQAAGLTPIQLAASIAKLLTKFVTDPQVTVMVREIRSRMIFMSGEINRPGAIPLLRNMTALQAVSMAGGPNQFANAKKIIIVRTENGKQTRFPFNYKNAIKGKASDDNILLKPGDTIVVP